MLPGSMARETEAKEPEGTRKPGLAGWISQASDRGISQHHLKMDLITSPQIVSSESMEK